MFYYNRKGRREREWACPGGVSSRMLRIPKYSAGTLWLCPVAAPSSLPAAAKGAAWLRPWFSRRTPRHSNHSSKAAARTCPFPLPAALHMCYKNKHCIVCFVPSGSCQCCTRACLKYHSRHLLPQLCVIFTPYSGYIARYAPFIWRKFPTNCQTHLPKSTLKTRFSTTANKPNHIEFI